MDSSPEKLFHLDDIIPVMRQQLDSGLSLPPMRHGGTSMMPMIRPQKDYVILSPPPARLKKYDLPLYQRKNGQYVLHRVVKVGKSYTCIGDNQFQLEHGITHDQVIAVVTAIERDGKRIPLTSAAYWWYCRYWHYSRPFRYWYLRGKDFLRRHFKKKA